MSMPVLSLSPSVFDSHLAFMKDYKFNYSLYFISIFPLEPINALASIASARKLQLWDSEMGFQCTPIHKQRNVKRIYVTSWAHKTLPFEQKVLRQSIVYWLEVSTWEFTFSLDFHCSSLVFSASCSENASLLFLDIAQTSGMREKRIWKKSPEPVPHKNRRLQTRQ